MNPTKQFIKETLQFEDLTPEEKEKRGILGRLYGPCASITIPTRNGRKYNEKLWDYQFANNEILKEMFENGGVPMELDHPQDREETQSDKIAAMMPELPKKDKDGHLVTYVDLIDTPMGRIAYQLAKYGFKLGISSRGTGDLITDEDGNESVDPETYELTTFDLVLVPAVKDARLEMCESLNKDNKTMFKQALTECLNQANEEDKKSLTEAINDLGISISNDDNIDKSASVKLQEETKSANDTGDVEVIKSLQEALKEKTELEKVVQTLQEKLAVSNAKAETLQEEVNNYKDATIRLSSRIKSNKVDNDNKVSELQESLDVQTNKTNKLNSLVKRLESENTQLKEQVRKASIDKTTLKEQVVKNSKKDKEMIQELNESMSAQKKLYEDKISSIEKEYDTKYQESQTQIKNLNEKLSKNTKVIENYKTLAKNAFNKYISTKATILGIEVSEITSKLNENYSLEEVDKVCSELQEHKLNLSKLPISLSSLKNNKTKVKVITDESLPTRRRETDDEVDDNLLSLAGLL